MILDTNAITAAVSADVPVCRLLRSVDTVYLPAIACGEYEAGLLGWSRAHEARPIYADLIDESILLSVEPATATVYAGVKHDLKGRGRPIPENDLWIAALALQHGLPILSRDAHFDAVPGVTRLGW